MLTTKFNRFFALLHMVPIIFSFSATLPEKVIFRLTVSKLVYSKKKFEILQARVRKYQKRYIGPERVKHLFM